MTNRKLKLTLNLLEAFVTTQFVEKATYSQRVAATPFFVKAMLHTFDGSENPLPTNFMVANAKQALEEHQASIAAGLISIDPVPAQANDWLTTLQDDAEGTFERLERADPVGDAADAERAVQPEPAVTPKIDGTPEDATIDATRTAVPVETNVGNAAPDDALAGWEQPVELAEAYGPDFPLMALAPWHQRFVAELAEQLQIAQDVPALASLAMIGAAAAKTALVEIQPGDTQPTNFWTLVCSPPGDGKTPLLTELRRPFDEVQESLRDAARADEAHRATEHRIGQIELGRLEREAARSEDTEEKLTLVGRAVELRKQLGLRRHGLPTLTTGDCTQLGLLSLMEANWGRLLLLTDEGDQLFSRIQQRSPRGAEDIDDMLKAYSGATIDRHDARREIRVPEAALSVVATIQPGPFAKVMGIDAYHAKGFIGRFALAAPRSIQGSRKQRRSGLSKEARAAYQGLVRGLLERPLSGTPTVLSLTEEAFEQFAHCGSAADRDIVANKQARLGAWLGKLRGLTARVAGILHLSEPSNRGTNTISGETMAHAAEIGAYFLEHARVAYAHCERAAADENPRRLLAWICDGRRAEFSHSEAVASFSGRLRGHEVDECLDRLIATKVLRELPIKRSQRSHGGRPRKPSYLVNPYVLRSR